MDASDDQGFTGLQMAAANGHDELVRLLIMRGAALDKCNIYDWTPLLHAARHGHTGAPCVSYVSIWRPVNTRVVVAFHDTQMLIHHVIQCLIVAHSHIDMYLVTLIHIILCLLQRLLPFSFKMVLRLTKKLAWEAML